MKHLFTLMRQYFGAVLYIYLQIETPYVKDALRRRANRLQEQLDLTRKAREESEAKGHGFFCPFMVEWLYNGYRK